MKTKIFLPLLMCFVLSTYAQKKEIRKAESAVENKEYDEAKALLDQVKDTYTNENESWQSTYLITKGYAYMGYGLGSSFEDLKTAAEAFKQAIALGENKDDAQAGLDELRAALVNNAVEDQKKDKNMMASKKLIEAYNLGKQDTLYLYYAAGSALNAQEYDVAMDYYKQLLELGYDGSQTLYKAKNAETGVVETFGNKILRDASVKSGSHIEAEDDTTPSKKGEIAKYLSLIYIEKGQTDKAIETMKIAKASNPDDVSLLQAEADLYYEMKDIKKYNEIMAEIAEKNPNDPIVFYNLGVSAEKLNDYEKAKGYYLKSIELDPKLANSYNNIASIILAKDRELTEEMNKLGMSAADEKKYDQLKSKKLDILREAIPYLTKTVELDKNNVNAMKYLKSIYYQLGENSKADEMDKLIQATESK